DGRRAGRADPRRDRLLRALHRDRRAGPADRDRDPDDRGDRRATHPQGSQDPVSTQRMMQLTPLDPSRLSPAAQRALGPGPGRTMAARGLLPLAPADQVAVLYQLSLDAESSLALSARATAAGLPEKLLAGTLTAPSTDPRILDFFAQLIADKPAVFDAIALNPSVADQTIATLAARAASREVDLIAQNEQRLLRHPEIIAAMYLNRRARMSTIDRVVELAVRNHVRVPGLACWDEVARALTGNSPATPDQ